MLFQILTPILEKDLSLCSREKNEIITENVIICTIPPIEINDIKSTILKRRLTLVRI